MPEMMDQEDTMQGETGAVPEKPTEHSDEPVSIFLPKSAFGDRPPKVGDSLKDFKIVEIDPETGDAEAKCTYEDDNEEPESMDSSFDRAMPEEKY